MKTKFYYEINIFTNGKREIVNCLSEKEKNYWLITYFTLGAERFWAYDRYQEYVEERAKKEKWAVSFEKFIKRFVKSHKDKDIQSFLIRPHYIIIIIKKKII